MANIGKSISIKGDLTGNEDMVIEGKVEGKVDLPNNQLTVGANGTVRAEISAKGVVEWKTFPIPSGVDPSQSGPATRKLPALLPVARLPM